MLYLIASLMCTLQRLGVRIIYPQVEVFICSNVVEVSIAVTIESTLRLPPQEAIRRVRRFVTADEIGQSVDVHHEQSNMGFAAEAFDWHFGLYAIRVEYFQPSEQLIEVV